jgi:hypothetical protein
LDWIANHSLRHLVTIRRAEYTDAALALLLAVVGYSRMSKGCDDSPTPYLVFMRKRLHLPQPPEDMHLSRRHSFLHIANVQPLLVKTCIYPS